MYFWSGYVSLVAMCFYQKKGLAVLSGHHILYLRCYILFYSSGSAKVYIN